MNPGVSRDAKAAQESAMPHLASIVKKLKTCFKKTTAGASGREKRFSVNCSPGWDEDREQGAPWCFYNIGIMENQMETTI